MKKRRVRDYSYEQWRALPAEKRLEIIHDLWDPREPKLGEATRGSILDAFGEANPHLLTGNAESRTVYFTNWGWCIAVLVVDPSLSVPTEFDEFRVVKGVTETPDDPFRTVRWPSQ